MVFFDALTMKFRNVKIRGRNPACSACGPECPEVERVKFSEFDYADFCQTKCSKYDLIKLPAENTMSCEKFDEVLAKMEPDQKGVALVDVRAAVQFNIVNTNESKKISEKVKAKLAKA